MALAVVLLASTAGATRVAFGSCFRQEPHLFGVKPAPWAHIIERKPDGWVWTGDIIYADVPNTWLTRLWGSGFIPAPPGRHKRMYDLLRADPEYAVLHRDAKVLGTWDDHDFGVNDGDRMYPYRAASQAAVLDFLDEPADSPRRKQKGIWGKGVIGSGPTSVRVLLLDVRYHKDPYNTPGGDWLGPEQWEWLERELAPGAAGGAGLTVIASGVQVLEMRGGGEYWGRFPDARRRLLRLAAAATGRGEPTMLISGDVHFAEIAAAQCTGPGGASVQLHEVTASGLTHAWWEHPVPLRWAFAIVMGLGSYKHRVAGPYAFRNWGELDWDGRRAVLRVLGADGQVHLERVLDFSTNAAVQSAAGDDWQCVPLGGPQAVWQNALIWGVLIAAVASPLLGMCTLAAYGLRAMWLRRGAKLKAH